MTPKEHSSNTPDTIPRTSRATEWRTATVLVVAVLIIYAQVSRFNFVNWDDILNVYCNPYFHPPSARHLAFFWRHGYFELYMPVMDMFWGVCAMISLPQIPEGDVFNPSASVFHCASLLLHLANTILMWRLLRLVLDRIARTAAGHLRPRNPEDTVEPENPRAAANLTNIAAAAGTLLWALHPMQVESVAWVTGANNLLSGLFVLSTLLLYLSARTPGSRFFDRPKLALTLATATYTLALLSKPIAATTAFVAVLLAWGTSRPGESWGSLSTPAGRRELARVLALPAIWVVLALIVAVITHFTSTGSQKVDLPIPWRPVLILDSLWFYIVKLFIPIWLCVDYGRRPPTIIHHWWGYTDALCTLILGWFLWKLRNRALQTAALVSVAALLPVLGIVPFYLHRWSTVGDRYAYFAMIGPAIALAYIWRFVPMMPRLRQLLGALYACAVAFWLVQSFVQTATWRNTHTLFTQTLYVNPTSVMGMLKLGGEMADSGDPDGAVEVFVRVVNQAGDFGLGYYELGSILARRGDLDDGIAILKKSIQFDDKNSNTFNNLGMALAQKGDLNGAIENFRIALKVTPEFQAAKDNLDAALHAVNGPPGAGKLPPPDQDPAATGPEQQGVELARQGRLDDAVIAFRRSIQARPDYGTVFFNLGVTQDRQGDFPGAEASYRSAIYRKPVWPEAHFNLGMDLSHRAAYQEAAKEFAEAQKERPGWDMPGKALEALQKLGVHP